MIKAIKSRYNQKGFTLVELMVVIAILGILAAIAIPKFSTATSAANTAKIQADLRTIDSALVMYQAEKGAYAGAEITADLKKYLAEEPKPPKGKCIIAGEEKDIATDDSKYSIGIADNAPRAAFKGYTSGAFGKDGSKNATATANP